ncbi:MAG: cache domain-containing protein [Pseudomonadota bacterium]|nr:cache domain-containing protein [Pseudomonadota bacterium]
MRQFLVAACLATATLHCVAEEFATAADAEKMVHKAVKALGSGDQAKVFAEINDKKPAWVERDLYVMVYDMQGKVLAHGQNPKMVGKDLLEMKDADGKAFVKERVELAAAKGKFWQEYKFTDPVTKKILPKSAYCEKANEAVVCAGIYKR